MLNKCKQASFKSAVIILAMLKALTDDVTLSRGFIEVKNIIQPYIMNGRNVCDIVWLNNSAHQYVL